MSHTYETWSAMIKDLAQKVIDKALEVRDKTWNSPYEEGPEDLYLIADIDPIPTKVDALIDNWPWPFDMDGIVDVMEKIAPTIPHATDGDFDPADLGQQGTLQGEAFTDIPSAIRALDGWQSPSYGQVATSDSFKDNYLAPIPERAETHTILISQLSTFAQGYRDLYLSGYRDLEYTMREAIERLDQLLDAAEAASIAEGYALGQFAITMMTGGGIAGLFSYAVGAAGRAEGRTDIGKWSDVLSWVNNRLDNIPVYLDEKEKIMIDNMQKVTDYVRSNRRELVLSPPKVDDFEPTGSN